MTIIRYVRYDIDFIKNMPANLLDELIILDEPIPDNFQSWILDHNPNFKWLLDNQERYNQILRESKINGNVVTVRTQAKNMVPSDVNTIKDNTFTSSF